MEMWRLLSVTGWDFGVLPLLCSHPCPFNPLFVSVSEPGESIGLQIKGKVQFPFFSCSVLKPFCES